MSIYQLTTSIKVVKEPQFVKEIINGITPSSASFTAIPTIEFSPTIESNSVNYSKLGYADISRVIEDFTDYSLLVSYAPIDTTLLQSMLALTGSNNREDSFTFLMSQQHDNGSNVLVEMYQILKGCRISSVTISIETGNFVTIESEWFAKSIDNWNVAHGLTSPNFASTISTVPWSAITTGASPLTFEGATYDIDSFSCTINHNAQRMHLLTQNRESRIETGIRDISIDISVIYKDNVLSESVRTLEPASMSLRLHMDTITGTETNLIFSDVYLESYDETINAESTDAKIISYSGAAASLLIETVEEGAIVRAVPLQTILISDSISILKLPRRITKALATETITVSAGSVAIVKTPFTGIGNFAAENFVPENFMVPGAGVVKAVPTQTVTISDSRARLASKIRTKTETAITTSESKARLAAKNRTVPTQTVAISETVNRVKTTPGGPNNVVRAVPTQTVSVSESLGRLAAKIRRATSS